MVREIVRSSTSPSHRLRVVDVPYDDPDSARLMAELDRELAHTYGSGDREPVEHDAYHQPHGIFLVGYDAREAVACGGMRLRYDIEPGELDAEIKRMYVDPNARRHGWGAAILTELLESATAAGAQRAVLETGSKSEDALRLYLRFGFEYIEPYSTVYKDSPTNRGLARELS